MDLPFSVEMLKHRAGPLEQTRLRCLCRDCPLRSQEEKQEALKNNVVGNATAEIDNEDLLRDGTDMAMDEDGAVLPDAENDEPMTLPTTDVRTDGDEQRDFLVDLWPHSRPWRRLIATTQEK